LTALPAETEGARTCISTAVEHADGIVFLHAAEDGPANRSYGLQVAKLAGVPLGAIRRAREYLSRLDKFKRDRRRTARSLRARRRHRGKRSRSARASHLRPQTSPRSSPRSTRTR
jgi:DNA mismatch repair ATPase MutS